MKNILSWIIAVLIVVLGFLGIVALALVVPLLSFGFGYMVGIVAVALVGDALLSVIQLVGPTATTDIIPPIMGVLFLLGSIFRSRSTIKTNGGK